MPENPVKYIFRSCKEMICDIVDFMAVSCFILHRTEDIMREINLYNTLTKKIEPFVPDELGKVKMYTCGPTVYHFAHIGNLRSYIMEDVLEKTFRYAGYDVKRVMNITDVGHLSSDADSGEDKMFDGEKREHKNFMVIAAFYQDSFFED